MVATYTANLELTLPALGDDVNTWGAPILNNNQTTIDQVLGTSSPNISLGSGGTTTITNVNAAFQIIVLTGTLTSNATLQFPSTMGGRRYIDSSAVVLNGFTITVQNGASDPGIIVAGAQGFGATRVPIVLNQSNAAYDQAGQATAAALSNAANGPNGLLQLNASGFEPALSKMGLTSGAAQGAGNIGQIISADVPIGSAITLFGATPANICSVPLTAGFWLIIGNFQLAVSSPTNINSIYAWISTASASFPASKETSGMFNVVVGPDNSGGPVGPILANLSTPMTCYLSAQFDTLNVGPNPGGYGLLTCVRLF